MRKVLSHLLIFFFCTSILSGTIATAPANAAVTSPAPSIVITETAAGALQTTAADVWWLAGEMNGAIKGTIMHTDGNYVDIVLPAGVTFSSTPRVKVTVGDLTIGQVEVVNHNTLRFQITEQSNVASTITISNLAYSVLNQPALGDIVAQVGADYNQASNNPLEELTIGASVLHPTAVFIIGAATFTLNGVAVPAVAPAYVKNNRTYLAIRDIGTALGVEPYNILWDEVNQRITMIKGDKIVQMIMGSTIMRVNGTPVVTDVAPEYGPGDRSFLPAAFLAQAFGETAYWDGLTSTITIKGSTY